MSALVQWAALLWWSISLALLCVSIGAALAFPWPRRAACAASPPLTAIVPIKELDEGFDAAQASLFEQVYPDLEIVIASSEEASPALPAARAIQDRYGHVASSILISSRAPAASPKLGNLWAPIEGSRHDLVLTKDSNVVLAAGDVGGFVGQLRPGVGLVSAITVIASPQSRAAWVEASIVNGHYARMLMLARALGMGFGLGKIMLFRRSDLDRAGGLPSLAWALGEDSAMAAALSRLGLRTVLADSVTIQNAGARPWRDLWNRLLRWKLIWRVQRPSVFVGSLLGSALLASVAGGLAGPLLRTPPLLLAAGTLLAWFGLEHLMFTLKRWPLSQRSPIAFLTREAMELLVWLRALTTSEVSWAGAKCRSQKPGGLHSHWVGS